MISIKCTCILWKNFTGQDISWYMANTFHITANWYNFNKIKCIEKYKYSIIFFAVGDDIRVSDQTNAEQWAVQLRWYGHVSV